MSKEKESEKELAARIKKMHKDRLIEHLKLCIKDIEADKLDNLMMLAQYQQNVHTWGDLNLFLTFATSMLVNGMDISELNAEEPTIN